MFFVIMNVTYFTRLSQCHRNKLNVYHTHVHLNAVIFHTASLI